MSSTRPPCPPLTPAFSWRAAALALTPGPTQPPSSSLVPRSFSPADLKRLHDGEYALAMHATIAGAQKTLAISSAFRLQGGTPAGSCEGGTSADGGSEEQGEAAQSDDGQEEGDEIEDKTAGFRGQGKY